MVPRFTLAPMEHSTCFGPLVALGFFMREHDLWAPIRHRVHFDRPTHCLNPVNAIYDLWVGILAGCEVVSQVNTTIRADPLLARAWGREQFHEQSTIARVLDACTSLQVRQMREANEAILHWLGQAHRHDFSRSLLRVDIDLSGLPASKRAEGSTKGYFSGRRNSYERQLVRIGATDYREVVASLLYPGTQTSLASLQPAVLTLERVLYLDLLRRQRTLIRLDGGFGSDDNLAWLLNRSYQLIAKGYSGKRAAAYARQVRHWIEVRPGEKWVALSPVQLAFPVPTQTVAVRWLTPKRRWRHALYITTDLNATPVEVVETYDDRGAGEVEIQTDHMGLLLRRRRKRSFAAQEMLVLLNDLAHNWLAWLHAWVLQDTPFKSFGPKRIIRDLLSIPGEADIVNDELIELRLKASHPYAAVMTEVLEHLWQIPDQ
ncbi:MAG TPA: hypothetical protein ENF84_02440 [Chloroflexi bacterium]|nr:hypothetical protein [Chloroflexota bacterium]